VEAVTTPALIHNRNTGADNAATAAKQQRFYSQAQEYGQGVHYTFDPRRKLHGNLLRCQMDDELQELVRTYLIRLSEGEISPSEAADWALDVMQGEQVKLVSPRIWRALDELAGADLLKASGEYLHGPEDFTQWLAEFGTENSD
jgi:hypothetical protein